MVAQKQQDGARGLVAELASVWGVNPRYRDATGRLRESPGEAVVEVLEVLSAGSGIGGCPGTGGEATQVKARSEWLHEALEARRAEIRGRLVEPVLVAWDGRLIFEVPRGARVVLLLEDGSEQQVEVTDEPVDCAHADKLRIRPRGRAFPFGYHRLQVESGDRVDEATVISAPRHCWADDAGLRQWGVFAPTYALRSAGDWGAGDLASLATLRRVVSEAGGSAVATLPLLASYLDRPFEPSPYTPVSRLFWNEFYLALDHIPEWEECGPARAVWESSCTQEMVQGWRAQTLVDYAGVMALKRTALEKLCRHFFQEACDERRDALKAFVRRTPEVLAYADYRAKVEARGCDWRDWPRAEQFPTPTPKQIAKLSEAARYHLYSQWQMEEQLGDSSDRHLVTRDACCKERSAGLFLDVPVGVHPGGFDVWKHRELFGARVSIGAPPDAFFSLGQSWDSPPLHPERLRYDGYRYWSQILRHHMRFAERLRIDHIMWLHRLFWIPDGREPREGVYVDYPTDELYAVLCLESHRHKTMVTGEDLGTVPPDVRPRMRRHAVTTTWVLQAALRPRSKRVIGMIPKDAVAAMSTHDMFPLAGFLKGDDILSRVNTGQLDKDGARQALAARGRLVTRLLSFLVGETDTQDPAAILGAALSYLGASGSSLALVNLDDLLLQREPHNVPGTGQASANWRRRLDGDEVQVERAIVSAAARLGGSQPRSSQ